MLTAQKIIDHYGLEPLDQEGGFFNQVWRSPVRINNEMLNHANYPEGETHPMGTIIQFLLTSDSFSAMHRLPTIEHWMYHMGDAVEMLLLSPDGGGKYLEIGPDLKKGQLIHTATPVDTWQGTRVIETKGGCGWFFGSAIMIPGFEWSDFELGDADALCKKYPEFADAIRARCRKQPHEGAL